MTKLLSQLRLTIAVTLCTFLTGLTLAVFAQQPPEKVSLQIHEGTTLGFDLSSDGRSIVFDLLGQLWILPAKGGVARPITDAVRDVAEDLDPTFSSDGRRVVFRGERNGRTGLWLLTLNSSGPRQLTQLAYAEGYDGNPAWSPDDRVIAFTHAVAPSSPKDRWRTAIMLFDVASGSSKEISITGLPTPNVTDPFWFPDGKVIGFVTRGRQNETGGRIWKVGVSGGQASPITSEGTRAIAPAISKNGLHLAYFAPDAADRKQVWTQEMIGTNASSSRATQVTNHRDVTTTRIRWASDGKTLFYSADGRLWKVAASGGQPTEISFTAHLTIPITRKELSPARFPIPGQRQAARGFMGLALSPDGRQIGMLALGKLWIVPVDGSPLAIVDVPLEATSLAWSPDGTEVAWSAGAADNEDLFATNLSSRVTRRVTSLVGREAYPVYSPDGRYLAFVHVKDDGMLRVVDARASNISDPAQTKTLGSIGQTWTSTPQWSPNSDGLLVCGGASLTQPNSATFISLAGQQQPITRFPSAPIFLQWTRQGKIVFVRHDRLWQVPFDQNGIRGDPKPIGTAAALYASASNDGTLLFVSEGGLRLSLPDGTERKIGWPLSYTPPVAQPLLLRNVRIFDGSGSPLTAARDILIENGRIARIAKTGDLSISGVRLLDAGGRVVIPGLIDLHAHEYRPDLLAGFPYFGITTIRDQGSSMAPLVSYADDVAAGVYPGPRVGYGGFQFYSDWPFDEEQGRGIEPEQDPEHIKRAVDLAEAFGAQHIKTRTFRRWDINARMILEAHRRGMRATGHCSHLLPLIAAGMDAKEHIGSCETRGDKYMYDDLIQLFRAAHVGVVPTITYFDFAVRLNERPTLLEEDKELVPFLPARENFGWMLELTPAERKDWAQEAQRAREMTMKFWRAGITLGVGTDIWQIPTGVHFELEQLVASGLTPAQAIQIGTANSAKILGADQDLGTIQVGKWADLVILDADPLSDIRNTRKIWNVLHYGQIVDRPAILKSLVPK